MKISRAEVEHVAKLARLSLTEDQYAVFTPQINNILEYIEKLNELDTANVPPTSHAIPLSNAFREDEVKPSIGLDLTLANAPEKEGSTFVVPRVI
ncbi:MAG: Asp-tRNA(Asn)/Glu-tRNA(Gln) amidotransferase subunit GatC [Deltaproteobacteria bacterium]|nr:Asp-tRNA(Asn)/Glu-tRNA(Gln) amidotransferase subunit GatC [Deltaproteobacteria bacterium]MBF0509341.1 Asp-tRNA(Asn)/Glu-tRNA(Gln) amidotransferase subunit GatC [Deltaproteobacteria bacterium]MBF0524042.1 Asp-tRNA(Asn)/Glu-tRNA(Gln) amidotransferase subunit GatC [Deltaproteobacteria bacterium]